LSFKKSHISQVLTDNFYISFNIYYIAHEAF